MQLAAKTTRRGKSASKTAPKRRSKRNVVTHEGKFQFPTPRMEGAPSFALTLPNIVNIPPKLVYKKSADSVGQIAASFIDLGLAIEADAAYGSSAALFLESVFSRWIGDRVAGLKYLRPCFELTDDLDSMGESNPDKEPLLAVGVSFSSERAGYFSLKGKIEYLETAVPGLGQMALNFLYKWLGRTAFSISPDFMLYMVEYHIWQGCSDENTAKAELVEMGEDPEDYDIPTKEEFEAELPSWVHSPSAPLKKKDLKGLAKHRDPIIAAAAKHLLAAPTEKQWSQEQFITSTNELCGGNENVGYAAVLSWENGVPSIAGRALDDWQEYAYSGGSTELFGVYLSSQDREGISSLFSRLELFIKTMKWADSAISLFASIDD